MKRAKKPILPVLLGADLNAYSVALSFMESYGVKSHAFMKYKCGQTAYSRFITSSVVRGIEDRSVLLEVLLRFAAENADKDLYLIPCTDNYVSSLQGIKGVISHLYKLCLPETRLWHSLKDKRNFYSMLAEDGIPYPTSVFFSGGAVFEGDFRGFEFPAVIKPADSAEYWRHPFANMQKVYFVKSRYEACEAVKKIFASGYTGDVILQRFIGGDSVTRVFTTYSNKAGQVARGVLGEVVLEEWGRTSYGNHSAIVTVPPDSLSYQLVEFLNKRGYVGFANFDIMESGGERYVLEVNTRQGRSCDYLRAAGVSIARLIVEGEAADTESPFHYKEIYWHYPSHKTVLKYSDNKRTLVLADTFYRTHRAYSPYENNYDGFLSGVYSRLHAKRLDKRVKEDFYKREL